MQPLQIAVCVKPVPDPKESTQLKINPKTKTLVRKGIPQVINPLDRNALEAGVKLKEANGGKVTVFSMAPPEGKTTLLETLALGADAAVLLSDSAFAGGDTLATARVLVAGIKAQGDADLIICGAESFDGGTAQVGSQIAVLLGIPWITRVQHLIRLDDKHIQVTVEDETEQRELRVALPVVLTVEAAINQPRPLSLWGIVDAREKEVTVNTAETLPIEQKQIGLVGSPTQTDDLFTPETTQEAEILTGDNAQQMVNQLLDKLGWARKGAAK